VKNKKKKKTQEGKKKNSEKTIDGAFEGNIEAVARPYDKKYRKKKNLKIYNKMKKKRE